MPAGLGSFCTNPSAFQVTPPGRSIERVLVHRRVDLAYPGCRRVAFCFPTVDRWPGTSAGAGQSEHPVVRGSVPRQASNKAARDNLPACLPKRPLPRWVLANPSSSQRPQPPPRLERGATSPPRGATSPLDQNRSPSCRCAHRHPRPHGRWEGTHSIRTPSDDILGPPARIGSVVQVLAHAPLSSLRPDRPLAPSRPTFCSPRIA